MYCRKCGRKIDEPVNVCPTCGEVFNESAVAGPKKKVWPKVLIILGSVALGITILGIIIVLLVFNLFKNKVDKAEDKLVCKSTNGNITLIFENGTVLGYTATGIYSYDLDEQKPIVKKYGIEEYKRQFNEWFIDNSKNGYCEDNGVRLTTTIPKEEPKDIIPIEDFDNDYVTVYIFSKEGCPYCAAAKNYLDALKITSDLNYNVVVYEVYDSRWNTKSDNLEKLMEQVGDYFNTEVTGVPYIVVGDSFNVNEFGDETGELIKNAIISASESGEYFDLVQYKAERINEE